MNIQAGPSAFLQTCRDFSFVLLPNFSMLALSGFTDILAHANSISPDQRFSWSYHTEDGQSVASSTGLLAMASGDLDSVRRSTSIVVCGGPLEPAQSHSNLMKWLRRIRPFAPMICGLGSGADTLAAAGVLDGYRAAVERERLALFRERFPRVISRDTIFEMHRNLLTCAGESSSLDAMIYLLGFLGGPSLADAVCRRIATTRIRSVGEVQPPSGGQGVSVANSTVREAATFMAEHIETVISIRDLSGKFGTSRRHLERLFRKHLGMTPREYYTQIRLNRARQYIVHGHMTASATGIACGFGSLAGFTRAYSRQFGRAPTQDRLLSLSNLSRSGEAMASDGPGLDESSHCLHI